MECSLDTTHHQPVSQAIRAEAAGVSPKLAGLSMNELDALYEAHHAAAEAFAAHANQPRVSCPSHLHTALCRMVEHQETHCDAVVQAMRATTTDDFWDRRLRAHRLISHACRCGDDIDDIAALARDLALADAH